MPIQLQDVSAKAVEPELSKLALVLNREIRPVLRALRRLVKLRHEEDFGDGAATVYTFRHELGTTDLVWSAYDQSTGQHYDAASITGARSPDSSTFELTFAAPVGAGQGRVVLRG